MNKENDFFLDYVAEKICNEFVKETEIDEAYADGNKIIIGYKGIKDISNIIKNYVIVYNGKISNKPYEFQADETYEKCNYIYTFHKVPKVTKTEKLQKVPKGWIIRVTIDDVSFYYGHHIGIVEQDIDKFYVDEKKDAALVETEELKKFIIDLSKSVFYSYTGIKVTCIKVY